MFTTNVEELFLKCSKWEQIKYRWVKIDLRPGIKDRWLHVSGTAGSHAAALRVWRQELLKGLGRVGLGRLPQEWRHNCFKGTARQSSQDILFTNKLLFVRLYLQEEGSGWCQRGCNLLSCQSVALVSFWLLFWLFSTRSPWERWDKTYICTDFSLLVLSRLIYQQSEASALFPEITKPATETPSSSAGHLLVLGTSQVVSYKVSKSLVLVENLPHQ